MKCHAKVILDNVLKFQENYMFSKIPLKPRMINSAY